jgi:hypothetical protein
MGAEKAKALRTQTGQPVRWREVLARVSPLGLTSFGSLIADLGYFQSDLVAAI